MKTVTTNNQPTKKEVKANNAKVIALKNETPVTNNEVSADTKELIEKFKATPQQLFRAVAMKKLNIDEYAPELVTPALKAEIGALTLNQKLAVLGITVEAQPAKETKAPVEKTEKAPKVEKAPVVTEDVTTVPVGSVIHYVSSKKPYIVTQELEKGRFIHSATQKFAATKSFPVVVLEKGTGELPVSFKDETLNTLLADAKAELESRKAIMAEAAAKKAARETAKAEKEKAAAVAVDAPKVEEVVAPAADTQEPKKTKKAKADKVQA